MFGLTKIAGIKLDLIELIKLLSAKPVVVSIAFVGALFTCLPFVFFKEALNKGKSSDDGDGGQTDGKPPWMQLINKFGYGLMGVSVFLFIVAGFVVDL